MANDDIDLAAKAEDMQWTEKDKPLLSGTNHQANGNSESPDSILSNGVKLQGRALHSLRLLVNTRRPLASLTRFCLFLVPSFITNHYFPATSGGSPGAAAAALAQLRPTAYLDGLRGLAAAMVVNKHLVQMLSTHAGVGWGHGGRNHELYKLPIVRLIQEGDAAVSIFFVVSGYALSISPVLAMRRPSRDPALYFRRLASSILRRPMRLYLPVWAATLVVFFLVRTGYLEYFIVNEDRYRVWFAGWVKPSIEYPRMAPTFLAQLAQLAREDARMLQVFSSWRAIPWMTGYVSPSWTIPLEFRASLALFLVHAVAFFMRPRVRLAVVAFLVLYGVSQQAYDLPLFWIGYLLAELSPNLSVTTAPSLPVGDAAPSRKPRRGRLATAAWITVGIIALHLCSYPSWGADATPGYRLLTRLSPWEFEITERFWAGLGATLLVASLDRLEGARAAVNWAPVQYLGRICFAFYLMHLWIMHTFGLAVFHYAYNVTGMSNLAATLVGFVCAYGVLWSAILVVSDLFYRVVDVPATALGARVEAVLFAPQQQ